MDIVDGVGVGPTDVGVAVRFLKDLGVDVNEGDLCSLTLVYTFAGPEGGCGRLLTFGADDKEALLNSLSLAMHVIDDAGSRIFEGEIDPWS